MEDEGINIRYITAIDETNWNKRLFLPGCFYEVFFMSSIN